MKYRIHYNMSSAVKAGFDYQITIHKIKRRCFHFRTKGSTTETIFRFKNNLYQYIQTGNNQKQRPINLCKVVRNIQIRIDGMYLRDQVKNTDRQHGDRKEPYPFQQKKQSAKK